MKKVYFACLVFLSLNAFSQNPTAPAPTGGRGGAPAGGRGGAPAVPPGPPPGPEFMEPGTKPVLLRSDFAFTEGPAIDKKGNVFFTDRPNDKIWKYDPAKGEFSVFLDKTGRADGMYFDKKGNLIVAADEKYEMWSISPKGKVDIFITNYKGKELNGPNDVWVHPDGGMYITDPWYRRDYWTRTQPQILTKNVFFIGKDRKTIFPVDTTLVQPNGIIGTADGKTLYVADISGRKTYKYQINKDGTLSNKQLFLEVGSDGMTMDSKGNLYLTGGGQGVSIYSPEGKKLGQIDITRTTNAAFGGKNRDILFVTGGTSLYSVQMKVRGGPYK